MKARLHIRDIGGLKKGDFIFRSDKLNIIESANSSGKTSIVKALTGILSIPKNGAFPELIFGEALKLGVKTDPHNPFEGFVNVHANQGHVNLEFNSTKEEYIVQQNGNVLIAPEHGDERFLLAGVLSNNSRVLRQLRGLDEREPDDFKWAVEELSYAQRYFAVSEVLKTWKEDFVETQELVNKSIDELKPLVERQSTIERKLEKLDSEISGLTEILAGTRVEIEKLVTGRNESLGKLNRWKEEMQKKTIEKTRITRTQLTPKLNDLKKAQVDHKKAESKLEITRKEIASLMSKQDRKGEIEREVNNLLKQRNTLDGMLNLYIMAETSIRGKQTGRVLCPLCRDGSVSYQEITQRITEYRKEREVLNSKILKRNQEKQNIAIQLRNTQDLEKELREIVWEQAEKAKFINTQLRKPKEAIRIIDSLIDDYLKKIEKEQRIYNELSKEISTRTDITLNEEFDKKNQLRSTLHEELGSTRQRISELSAFEIFGNIFEPEAARLICKDLVSILKDRIGYLEKRAEEEREQAARRFNENINVLLASLGFKEFRTVRLTGSPSYRLYVERYDPKKKDYKSQEVGTLSTSEKLAISLILQMALKETYLKKVPFLIMDDALEDFDLERRERVIEYLKEKVTKENWFIIATKLVEELGPPRVKYL
jgi:DNA repair exonuclease SbcCD ATPase subunit